MNSTRTQSKFEYLMNEQYNITEAKERQSLIYQK